ncbi:hypothetical protein [Desulfospira joergensenii]|uniref:hypothetical protein n=1 Tax=Desulfospira joergensenii TaxID=53329 RepID=UPI0003B5BFBC|nr:hypothetical protein [Desulfospira joergensenii]
MALPNRKGWMAIIFMLICLAIPFGITYYVSTPTYKTRYQGWIRNNREAGIPSFSKVADNQVVLVKGDKVTVGKTCLVFRGVQNRQVQLDLYLLELDTARPYPMHFPANSKNSIIKLGDISYVLQSVRGKVLTMKIKEMPGTY